jgi:LysM repeat protein
MRFLKALVILTLLGAISAGAFGAYYFIILKPKELDKQDQRTGGPNAQPTPDPTTPEFEVAKALRSQRRYDEARTALESFLSAYPDSSHHREAEALLGDLNVNELLSGRPGPGKFTYIVQRGDVIDRVAKKTKSSAELIFRANNLDRIMLQIGQKLEVPQVDFAIEAHLGEKKLILINRGQFFKSYPILESRPMPKKVRQIPTKVAERIATKDGKRVVFGSKEYPDSLRSITLAGQSGFTIYGKGDMPTDKAPSGGGIALSPSDAEEVHTLVSVGTPVILSAN